MFDATSQRGNIRTVGVLAAALATLAVFAQGGFFLSVALAALLLGVLVVLAIVLRLAPITSLVAAPLLIFIPQASGFRWFDLVALVVAVWAALAALASRERRAFELHVPAAFALAFLAVPVLALPVVVDPVDWLAGMKRTTFCLLLYFGLRRVVRRADSDWLLVAFPLAGAMIAFQVFGRLGDVGTLMTTRPTFRNFYTDVGWGKSNYVAAMLVLCIGGTFLAACVARSTKTRLAALGTLVLQFQAYLPMQSRAATVALGVGTLAFALSSRASVRLWALVGTALFAGLAWFSLSGQALATRFADPTELGSWLVRVQLWQNALERFAAHPWTGIGLLQGAHQGDLGGAAGPHNSLLEALMEMGILGGFLWAAFLVALVVLARRATPVRPYPPPSTYRPLVLGVVLAVIFNSMVEPTFGGYEYGMLFTWFLAWLTLQDPAAAPRETAA